MQITGAGAQARVQPRLVVPGQATVHAVQQRQQRAEVSAMRKGTVKPLLAIICNAITEVLSLHLALLGESFSKQLSADQQAVAAQAVVVKRPFTRSLSYFVTT